MGCVSEIPSDIRRRRNAKVREAHDGIARMTKMYTRRGDKGETDLMGGKRVSKHDLRVEALGDIDELNAVIGVAMTTIRDPDTLSVLHRVQNDLFTVGSDLSIPPGKELKLPKVDSGHVTALEADITRFSPEGARKFVLPGGSIEVAHLQLARTVARRAERAVVALSRKQKVNPHLLEYVNRLSTLLYVLALSVKKESGIEEEHPTYSGKK